MYTKNLQNGKEIFPHELLFIFTTAIFVRYYKNNDANSESYANELNKQAINMKNLVKNSAEVMCGMVGFDNVSFKKADPLENGKKSFLRRNESKRVLGELKKLLDENRDNLQSNKGWQEFINQCISMLNNEIYNLKNSTKNENLIRCLSSVKNMYCSVMLLTAVWKIERDCDNALTKNINVIKLKVMLYVLSEHLKIYCADSDAMTKKSARYVMNIIGMKDGNRINSIKRIIVKMRSFSDRFLFLLDNDAKNGRCLKEIECLYEILAGNFVNETGKWLFLSDGELIKGYNIEEFNNSYMNNNSNKSLKKKEPIERKFFCISYVLASDKMPKTLSSYLLKFDSGFSDFLSKDEKSIVSLMNNSKKYKNKDNDKNNKINKYDDDESKEREEDYVDDCNESDNEKFILLYKEKSSLTMYANKEHKSSSSLNGIIEANKNDDNKEAKKRSASLPLQSDETTSEIVEKSVPNKTVNDSITHMIN